MNINGGDKTNNPKAYYESVLSQNIKQENIGGLAVDSPDISKISVI